MLGHAPRGRPLRLVAQQVARLKLSSELCDYQDMIQRCPHIRRLHETFWDNLRRLIRAHRGDPHEIQNNANDKAEALLDIAIFGKSIVATSCQWPPNSNIIEEVMRVSFNEYASLHRSKLSWEGKCVLVR